LLDTTYGALSIGVKVLTVYAFSTENWRRPVDEVRYLMNFNSVYCNDANKSCTNRACGSRSPVDATGAYQEVLTNMKNASALTEKNKALTLNIAFNYGGRAEIVDASPNSSPTRSRPTRSTKRRCALVCITRNCRPGLGHSHFGEYRISNSCSGRWRTPMVFTDVLCRTFAREPLRAVEEYQQRERRFGVSTNDHDQDDGRRRRPHLRVPVALYASVTRAARAAPHSAVLAVMVALVWPAALHGHRTAQTALRRRVRRDRAVKEIRDDAVVLRTYKSGESDRVSCSGRAITARCASSRRASARRRVASAAT